MNMAKHVEHLKFNVVYWYSQSVFVFFPGLHFVVCILSSAFCRRSALCRLHFVAAGKRSFNLSVSSSIPLYFRFVYILTKDFVFGWKARLQILAFNCVELRHRNSKLLRIRAYARNVSFLQGFCHNENVFIAPFCWFRIIWVWDLFQMFLKTNPRYKC